LASKNIIDTFKKKNYEFVFMNNIGNNGNINDLPPQCLYEISKEIEGELYSRNISNQDCYSKGERCLVVTVSYALKAEIKSFLQFY
jgi:hypothetical protein